MYAKSQGRFTTTDPLYIKEDRLRDPQTLNLYVYVRNNPLALTDPTGLDFEFRGKDKDKFDNDLNNRDGAQFKVKLNKKGIVEVVDKDKVNVDNLSEAERELFDAINDTTNRAVIEGIDQDSGIDFGGFKGKGLNQIDAADMKLLRKADKTLAGEVIAHEMMEAYKSVELKTSLYGIAHSSASAIFPEPTIIDRNLPGEEGAESISGALRDYTFERNGKSRNITVEVRFLKAVTLEDADRMGDRMPRGNIVNITKPKKK